MVNSWRGATEDRDQRSEDRGQKTEGRSREKTEVSDQRSEGTPVEHPEGTRFNWAGRTEDGKRQKSDDRGRKAPRLNTLKGSGSTGQGGRRTERQKTDDR